MKAIHTKQSSVLTCLLLACGLSVAQATEKRIDSPDGKVSVTVSDQGGTPSYLVSLQGDTLILPSPLGIKTNMADLSQKLTMKDCEVKTTATNTR